MSDSYSKKHEWYPVQIAFLYACVWFIDLLDSTILNVSLPAIANSFHIDPTKAEWTILGFLLSLSASMSISQWISCRWGMRRIFLLSQLIYLLSSFLCGTSTSLAQLVIFRLVQGFAGGILIPLGMSLMMNTVPQKKWASYSSKVNMISLLAPALGPIIAGYITQTLGWPWLFYIKLPLSALCLGLSFLWVSKDQLTFQHKFDWKGFFTGSISILLVLLSLSKLGQEGSSNLLNMALLFIGALFLFLFVHAEKKSKHPLIPMTIFKWKLFSIGNLIQCSANVIFLGSIFITGLFLQEGLKYPIEKAGWILSPITLGMFIVLPIIARFYNRLGPLPFIIPGLFALSLSMFAFCWVTPGTHPFWIAGIIFIEGAASSIIQTPNVLSIFSEVTHEYRTAASAIYALLKQISASFGVALSTMILTIGLRWNHVPGVSSVASEELIPLFQIVFAVLGVIPLLALILCFYIDNKKAIRQVEQN